MRLTMFVSLVKASQLAEQNYRNMLQVKLSEAQAMLGGNQP